MMLEEAGLLNPITVTADPAFLIEPEDFPAELLREEGVPAGKRLVGISVREPGRAAEEFVQQYLAGRAEPPDLSPAAPLSDSVP